MTSQQTLILTIAASKSNFSQLDNPHNPRNHSLERLHNKEQEAKNLTRIH